MKEIAEWLLPFAKIRDDRFNKFETMDLVYKFVAHREQMLLIPFAQGINMAHNRFQEIVNKFKNPAYRHSDTL